MKRLLAGMAVALAAGPLAGQEAEPPVFPAGTEAVLLDMVVRDEDDRLVPDLRADEIQVFENGQLCAITSFRLVRAEDAGRPAPDLAGPSTPSTSLGPSPGTPGGARQGIVSPAEGARSTSVEDESLREPSHGGHERMGSVVLLVFDRLGLDAARRAREAALDMVGRPFADHTWFAVLEVGQGLSVLQAFTEDRSSLAAPIERATAGAERAEAEALDPGSTSAAEEAFALAIAAEEAEAQGAGPGGAALARASAALAALNARMEGLRLGQGTLYPLLAVSRSLRTVRGRKTMLYFSEGSRSRRTCSRCFSPPSATPTAPTSRCTASMLAG